MVENNRGIPCCCSHAKGADTPVVCTAVVRPTKKRGWMDVWIDIRGFLFGLLIFFTRLFFVGLQ